ncbi:MAG: metallophosphoesterase [Pseudomonadota bacterium]
MLTRRRFLQLLGTGFLMSAYAAFHVTIVEPMFLQRVKRDRFLVPQWPDGLTLRIVALADLHACEPWMNNDRIGKIVDQANRLEPDIVVLLGDYLSSMNQTTRYTKPEEWAPILGRLEAKHGVYAILGNHDWWEDEEAQRRGKGPTLVRQAFETQGVPVLENDALRLEKDGFGFWLAGLGDQLAFPPYKSLGRNQWRGLDDLPGTLAKVETDEPVILLAHEPDIFPKVPDRVSLTLSGHTHGGQVRLFGWSPIVPSAYKNRYAYGHVVEEGRHLLVSGGLGMSVLPLRFGVRPEINLIEIGQS